MTDDELRKAVLATAVEGKVPCKALLALAAQAQVPPAKVGQLCNELKLKIVSCQLGCFK